MPTFLLRLFFSSGQSSITNAHRQRIGISRAKSDSSFYPTQPSKRLARIRTGLKSRRLRRFSNITNIDMPNVCSRLRIADNRPTLPCRNFKSIRCRVFRGQVSDQLMEKELSKKSLTSFTWTDAVNYEYIFRKSCIRDSNTHIAIFYIFVKKVSISVTPLQSIIIHSILIAKVLRIELPSRIFVC